MDSLKIDFLDPHFFSSSREKNFPEKTPQKTEERSESEIVANTEEEKKNVGEGESSERWAPVPSQNKKIVCTEYLSTNQLVSRKQNECGTLGTRHPDGVEFYHKTNSLGKDHPNTQEKGSEACQA